jgi:two-component system, sensor histidine kinase and response regulator
MRTLGEKEHTAMVVIEEAVDLGDLKGSPILLVEDNLINQEIALELLTSVGLSVDLAENGQEAVAKTREKEYAGVLMDLQMPVMGGLEASEEITSDGQTYDLPIVAMTANAMSGDRERCIEAGMKDHIAKPIDPEDMYAKIRKWFRPLPESQQAETNNSSKMDSQSIDDQTWPDCIDSESALKSTNQNTALLRKILHRFVDDQKDVVDQTRESLRNDELKTAERLLHTLKGVSASIGAQSLHSISKTAEEALKDQMEIDESVLTDLREEHDKVLASIKIWSDIS